MLTRAQPPVEEHVRRKKMRLDLSEPIYYPDNSPRTPMATHSRWNPPPNLPPLPFTSYIPSPIVTIPPVSEEPMTNDELVKMKGPSKLIGFLVHIAMNEKARRALRWTGNGLEFVLVNKELVAKMWGNRKHNTKDMDYYKLSRAIREKYDKKDKDPKFGKLRKGTRTYSYVFTENSYQDLFNQTGKSIEYITNFALEIGNRYHDNADLNNSNSPLAPSPLNSD
uniref:ETS domain-containing protein n=1 Tax=Caenorhabditis tropicalis TaxID=1561998 RepID=A0A1I7TIA9_9PELO